MCGLNGPLLPQNPLVRVGEGAKPLTFSSGFCTGRGRFAPPKSAISGPEALVSNLKYLYKVPLCAVSWLGLSNASGGDLRHSLTRVYAEGLGKAY